MGTLSVVVGLPLLVVTGLALGDRFAPATASRRLLTTWIAAWTWLVVVSFALTAVDALHRTGLLVTLAVGAGCALALGRIRPPPPVPSLLTASRALLGTLRDDLPLFVLSIAVCGALAYQAALAWVTAPTEDDSLYYHLARVAFWAQQQGIGFLEGPFDPRVTGFPILAEIGKLDLVVLGGHERWAALVQLSTVVPLVAGVHSLGRGLGLTPRDAAFPALLVATLPVVALQGPTSLNDLVVASFLVAAGALVVGGSARESVAALGAVALLVASKGTAPFLLPVLLALAIAGQPRRRLLPLSLGGAAACVAGGFWYLANYARFGDFTGGTAGMATSTNGSDAPLPFVVAARITRRTVDLIETSGAVGRDRLVYAIAVLALLIVAALLAARGRQAAAGGLALGALLALAPLVLVELEPRLVDAHRAAWSALGLSGVPAVEIGADQGRASPMRSSAGPVGALLVIAAVPVTILEWRRRRLPGVAVVLASAPFVAMAGLAVVQWTESADRYLVGAIALSAGTWGWMTRRTWLRTGIVAIAAVTVVLSLWNNEDKPAGIRLLEPARSTSVWERERWEQQDPRPGVGEAGRIVVARVPEDATLALSITPSDPTYPFFGPTLSRTVVFGDARGVPDEGEWLLASGSGDAIACEAIWRLTERGEAGWVLYERIAPGTCPG